MTEIVFQNGVHQITVNGASYAKILPCEGATDTFEPIEAGAWRWHRHTDTPTDHMRMEMTLLGAPTFTMVPAVSYNGNGWGDTPEYVGDRAEDGTPWSWASHRATIPACTYSENEHISIALMAEANDNCACSLYQVDEGERHVLIFPEEEKPKTLHRHFWEGPFEGMMEPSCDFVGIIFTAVSDGGRFRYPDLLDFAWRYYGHPLKAPMKAKDLYKYSIAYCYYLFEREKDGFAGFVRGADWHAGTTSYRKTDHVYEIGWGGHSASLSNAFIYDYRKTKDKEKLGMALEALDTWTKRCVLPAGHIKVRFDFNPKDYDPDPSVMPDRWDYGENRFENLYNIYLHGTAHNFALDENGDRLFRIDACNNGTAAYCYFEAFDMLKKEGIDKPEYEKLAFGICDFALKTQDVSGCYAKTWDDDGNVVQKEGTIGCFLILPILKAYERTGRAEYLQSAVRAFDFYYEELEREGFTTAGALDTYSIDKESSSPLLRSALALFDITKDKKYISRAEKAAWYISTWMMHYTIKYPEDNVIAKMGYDTFGATSVSTPHQALDQYALRDVLSFLKLYEITGNIQWRERALAFWCNATQCVSDGTLVINGRIRPTGSQDEAVFHTRWRRQSGAPFMPSQWLPAWPCAYRMENLRRHEDWSIFDEGLTNIEGKIVH
ncbi:MAG: hypothetical protein E7643_09345 [Ruminococcaceae bacterium]|nr:hypothetical protein [Oscillospiraceae bacterium]